jgi:archaellin
LQYDNLTVLSLNYWNGTDTATSTVSPNGIFHTLNHSCLDSTSFGVIGIRDSDDSVENTFGLGTGDMCMIIVNLSAAFPETEGLQPGEELYGRLVPETGAAGIFLCNAPNAFDNRVVEL